MEIDRNQLAQHYATKEQAELLELHSSGTLTDLAYAVLEAELQARGVAVPPRPVIPEPERSETGLREPAMGGPEHTEKKRRSPFHTGGNIAVSLVAGMIITVSAVVLLTGGDVIITGDPIGWAFAIGFIFIFGGVIGLIIYALWKVLFWWVK